MNFTWRRQRLLIDRLQLRLMAINLLYLGVFALIFFAAVFGPFIYTLLDSNANTEAQQEAADSMLLLHSTIWPPFLVVVLIFAYHSIAFSHRIAGPLYRFRNVFEEVRDGNLRARAVLRTRDFLKNESHVLNSMIGTTEERVEGVADAVDAVRATVREIKAGFGGGACDVSLAEIERLGERVEEVRGRLDHFRLASSDRRDVPPIAAEDDPTTDTRPMAHV